MKTILQFSMAVFLLSFNAPIFAQAVQQDFINYQGVARNATGEIMSSEELAINIKLRFGAANATAAYEENHKVTTDVTGVFSLKIGLGRAVGMAYKGVTWNGLAPFITVAIDGVEVGTTEMIAVPYAIRSGDKQFYKVGSNDIANSNRGNVGIGTRSPGVEAGAGKYLTVATGITPSVNSFAAIEIQGGQGGVGQTIGRLDFVSNASPGNSAISRIESRTSGGAQFKGDLAFSTKDGSTFEASALRERLTIKNNGDVGIGTTSPSAKLTVNGDVFAGSLSTIGDINTRSDINANGAIKGGSLKTYSEVHTDATGDVNMLAKAYGTINADGTIKGDSGNFTVEREATGEYIIRLIDGPMFTNTDTIFVSILSNFRGSIINHAFAGGGIHVYTSVWNGRGFSHNDLPFSFILYRI